jgi:hypothetical protein
MAADDRMRLRLWSGIALALALPAAATASEDWLFDDAEERARRVNTGDLVFLDKPPEKAVHHHLTRLEITPEGLGSGWVALAQCHENLDKVPSSQIVYQPGRVRALSLVSHRNVGSVWVEGESVQLRDVAADAQVCVVAETRALHALGEGRYELRNGPFMRRFLDGYFPMHVSLDVGYPAGLELEGTSPEPQPGFTVTRAEGRIVIDAWFEGMLRTVIRFRAQGGG